MSRQKILITGASSGLGAGMARQFAAKGRDLALCARRLDNLDELKAELTARHPGITVAIAALDVNDHDELMTILFKNPLGSWGEYQVLPLGTLEGETTAMRAAGIIR